MIDIAIIGAGPAGLSAAINSVIRNKETIVFGNKPESSFLYKAERIDNYLGMPALSGKQMIDAFWKHANDIGVRIEIKKVQQIFPMGDYYTINANNEFYEAKKVIIAIGVPKSKYIKGEKDYIGKGVSYCATCDGMLYKNKTVILIGETMEAVEDIKYLSQICKKVYFISKYEPGFSASNIERLSGKATEIFGDDIVKQIKVDDDILDVDGIFFIRESTPIDSLISGLEMNNNYIDVNRAMETNFEGIYAAGDCTGKPLQLSKAVSEGLIAAQSAIYTL